jgi:hypothetical protein
VKAAIGAATRQKDSLMSHESVYPFLDPDTEIERHAASPTAHLLDELALYGHRFGEDQLDPRPLPEPNAAHAHLGAAVEALSEQSRTSPRTSGTVSSNPARSSGESTNHRFRWALAFGWTCAQVPVAVLLVAMATEAVLLWAQDYPT